LTAWYVAVQAPGGGGGADEDGGEADGLDDGVGDRVIDGVGDGVLDGVDDGVIEGRAEDGGADGVPPVSVGVVQSRQSARLPAFRLEILNTAGGLPVCNRNAWRLACSGAFHSGRTAQWVASDTSDQ
jgi:hypothetical protein